MSLSFESAASGLRRPHSNPSPLLKSPSGNFKKPNVVDENLLPPIDKVEKASKSEYSGFLTKKSLTGYWYPFWFSLKGSILRCYERREATKFRGLLVEEYNVFACTISSKKEEDDSNYQFSITLRDAVNVTLSVLVLRCAEENFEGWNSAFANGRKCTPAARPHKIASSNLKLEKPPDHLLFAIHGIGTDEKEFFQNVDAFNDQMHMIKNVVYPDVDCTYRIIPIRWREAVRSLRVFKRLGTLQPDVGTSVVREFLSDKGTDIFFYMTERYRNFILRETVSKVNEAYQSFLKDFPSFNGKISLLGHSLGGVISFDILSRQSREDPTLLSAENMKLSFEAKMLFLAGSPIGAFMNFEEDLLARICRPQPFSMFNIFNPYDPVSYRIEPLLTPPNQMQPPCIVPHYRTMDQRISTVKWLSSFLSKKEALPEKDEENNLEKDETVFSFNDLNNKIQEEREEILWTAPPRFNPEDFPPSWLPPAHARLDYVLQESAMEEVSNSMLNALKGHGEYWHSGDMALLIQAKWVEQMVDVDNTQQPSTT